MDTDSPYENIGQHSIKIGRNIRYRGDRKNEGGNLRIENIEGNTLIPYNQPIGINEGCGAFYDDLKQRVFGFGYNSNGFHSIRILYLNNLSIVPLLTNGTNCDMNVLVFTLDNPIYNVKILYGDDTQGDTIYFNNSLNEPCQINIERTLAGTYGTMKREFLEVIKYPANRPPYVIYGDDATVSVNTLRKKLFIFKIRPIYFSREKSVTSIWSELPLPINSLDTDIDKDPTKNCKISIVYETLGADVEKIEILGAVTGKSDSVGVIDPNKFGDFFLIQTIDKAALSLPNNDIATFVFYNDQAYISINPEESIQLQDLVPLQANALEFLNGNIPIYGGITEGFNLTPITGSVTSGLIPQIDTQLPFIFVGSQSGDSAFGSGNIHIIVIGTIAIGYSFSFITTNQTITFVATVATTSNVISGLATAAVSAGFTVISSDTQNLYIVKTGESLQRVVRHSPILSVTNGPSYNWNDKEAFSIEYFDKAGRTCGAETTQLFSFQTVNYTETATVPNIPQILLSITNRPPITAYYFTLSTTRSLAKLKFLYWISNSTYKDPIVTGTTPYAWIGIENLNTFIANNPNSKFLAYDFSSGDRIRFIKILSGTVNTVYVNQDFEIIGQQLSPLINGTIRTGQFIKIALPTPSGTFDFGTSDFSNYAIELYTPSQSIGDDLNEFKEFGERFTIGNPGTVNAYHQGMTQNQTANLSQPATFTFNKGGYYYRDRQINVGAEYKYNIPAYEQGTGRTTLGVNYISESYSDPNITPGSSPNQNLVGFDITTNTDRAILNVTTGTYTFRLQTAITVSLNYFGEIFSFYLEDSSGNITNLVAAQPMVQGPHTFPIDITFQMLPNTRIFIFAYSDGNYRNSKTYSTSDFKITRELPFTIPIVDANYSDYFPSAVNSYGRSFVEQPQSARTYNPILLRWGLPNILNTNINQVSRFIVLNFDEIDGTKGDIEFLVVKNRMLNVLQKRGCGWFSIYAKVIQDNSGKNVLVTTDSIITTNNIQYLEGDYGVGNQKGSVTQSKNGYYFTDPIRGYQIRRAPDGLVPLNELYYGQYLIRNLLTPYNYDYIRSNGSIAKILSYYDYFEEQYVSVLQGGSLNGNTIDSQMFSFNETRNAYCCFYDEVPEWILCAQDKTFEWRNGQVYIRNNTTNYGERFGIKTYPSVTMVFNSKEAINKTFNTLSYQSNEKWTAEENGDISTSEINEQTGLQQISSLIAEDFTQRGNYFDAALLRDANSMEDVRLALLEGDFLEGAFIIVKLTYTGDKFVYLTSPYINYELNPRNF